MKKNRKIPALITSILLLFIFGIFLTPLTKATETYITTEEYYVIKDSYTASYAPDSNYGSYPSWIAGYAGVKPFFGGSDRAFFGFNTSNIPEHTIKIQVKVPILINFITGFGDMEASFTLVNIQWEENTITDNNANLTFENTRYIMNIALFVKFMVSIYYLLDITTLIDDLEEITIVVGGPTYNSSLDEYPILGLTKESGDLSLVPSIIYTIENEVIVSSIPQTNEILFAIIGVFIGLTVATVIVSVSAILKKRKTEI